LVKRLYDTYEMHTITTRAVRKEDDKASV